VVDPDRIEDVFQKMVGISSDEALPHIRKLMGSFIRQGKFTAGWAVDSSTVSLSERAFAMFAFFALVGIGDLEVLGIKTRYLDPKVIDPGIPIPEVVPSEGFPENRVFLPDGTPKGSVVVKNVRTVEQNLEEIENLRKVFKEPPDKTA
jgi:hypothetical protein